MVDDGGADATLGSTTSILLLGIPNSAVETSLPGNGQCGRGMCVLFCLKGANFTGDAEEKVGKVLLKGVFIISNDNKNYFFVLMA